MRLSSVPPAIGGICPTGTKRLTANRHKLPSQACLYLDACSMGSLQAGQASDMVGAQGNGGFNGPLSYWD